MVDILPNFDPGIVPTAPRNTGAIEQVIGITDIIAEGPIGGLVRGGKSVFLDSDILFDDNETGYTSVAGQTVSRDPSVTTKVIINNFDKLPFDYDPDTADEISGTRYLFVHDVVELEDSASSTYTYNTGSSSDSTGAYQNKQRFFNLVIDGDFTASVFPDSGTRTNMVSNYLMSELNKNLVSGDGIVSVVSKDGDRQIVGTISAISDSQITIKLQIPTLDNGFEWIKEREVQFDGTTRANFKLKFSQFLSISSITGNEITLSGPVYTFSQKTFSITKVITNTGNNGQQNKVRSSGVQFVPGLKDQPALQTVSGSPGSVSVPLEPIRELETGVPKSITYRGASAGSIDTVHLHFKYPSGLYAMNMDDAKKRAAGAAYVIHLALDVGTSVENFQSVGFLQGNLTISSALNTQLVGLGQSGHVNRRVTGFDSNGVAQNGNVNFDGTTLNVCATGTPIFAHGGKTQAGVSYTHTINLEAFQPFKAFKLTIVRITESGNTTDTGSGRAHAWNEYGGSGNLLMTLEGKEEESNIPKYQAIQAGGIPSAFGVIKERLNYPYTAMAHVTFNSRQFSNLPKRSYECYGLKVRIPTNYTPRERFGLITDSHTLQGLEQVGSLPDAGRLYSGLFTGALTDDKHYTNNPAWVFYDIVTNNRYGVGEYVRDSDIDIFSLYKIARYCDELVPDGKGGVEPRFTANLYLQKATDVYKVLKDMATIFRGMLYYMNGQITPIIDEPSVAVYNFNRSNVINGNFNFEYTGTKTRVNQIVVKWNNPDNEYKIEPLFVEDRDDIVRSKRIVKSEAFAFGCTSEGQAIRYGRWKLWTSLNQTEVVSFKTSINAAFLSPGDLINVQDNHDFGYSFGGRLKNVSTNVAGSTTTTTLEFDRNVAEDPNDETRTAVGAAGEYTIALILAEKNVVVKKPANVSGTAYDPGATITSWFDQSGNAVTVSSSWTDEDYEQNVSSACADANGTPLFLEYITSTRVKEITCNQSGALGNSLGSTLTTTDLSTAEATAASIGAIWGLKDKEETAASYKQYKILNIVDEEKGVFEITAVEHYNTKFDIIENNFTTSVADPLFPDPDPTSSVPPPRGLRVLRAPKLQTPGEELILSWNSPENDQNITGYDVTTTVPGYDTTISTSTTSLEFVEVPDGVYTFTVRSISGGRQSRPVSVTVAIEDYFGGNHVREKGVLKGGVVSSPSVIITTQGAREFKYETDPVFFFSPNDTTSSSKSLSFSGGPGLDYDILSAHRLTSWFDDSFLNDDEAFVFLSNYKNSGRELRLINHVIDPFLNIDYWYDQTKAIQKNYNLNEVFNHYPSNPDIWSAQNGQVQVKNNSSKVIGVGTSFTSQYKPTNVIKFSESQAAKISYIESDTVMYLDRSFEYKGSTITSASVESATRVRYTIPAGHNFIVGDSVAITGMSPSGFNTSITTHHEKRQIVAVEDTYFETSNPNTMSVGQGGNASAGAKAINSIGSTYSGNLVRSLHYKDELDVDYTRDFLIGKLDFAGNFRNFCTLDPDIARPRALILDSNIAALNYDGDTTPVLQTTYSDVTLSGIAIGFEAPEFKVEGDFVSGSAYSADTNFQPVPDSDTGQFTKQLLGASSDAAEVPAYNAAPLEFTVTVRETNDPENTAKTVTQTFRLIRIKDGASGTEGRTVSIDASDNSIVYDQTNSNPNPTSIRVTATPFNFPSDRKYRFKDGQGNILSSPQWQTNNFIQLNTPTKFNDTFLGTTGHGKVEVEVSLNVTPEVVSATDSTPIMRFHPGSPAMSVSLPNNTVAASADSNGVLTGTTIPNSAATIEVFFGATVGTYVGTSNNTANFGGGPTDANLQENQWYVSAVTDTDANLSAGNITGVSNNIISIADANRSGQFSGTNESITWTIKGKTVDGILEIPVSQTIFKSIAGSDGTPATDGSPGTPAYDVAGSNSSHLFIADENGLVDATANDFSTSFTVRKGGTTYTYDHPPLGTDDDTFSIVIASETNCQASVSSTGTLSLSTSNSTIFTNANTTTASVDVEIRDRGDNNSLIESHTLNFSKVKQAVRDGVSFSFTNVGTTHGPNWASSSLSNATAQYAAQQVINTSVDGHISPNDKITLIHGETAATRIYQGNRTEDASSSGPVAASSFSSKVTEFIDGSSIVTGTLSADTLAANTTISNSLNVADNLKLGNGSNAVGRIYSANKTSFSDTDAGFYMDGLGNVYIGDNSNYFKFDASNNTISLVAPNIQLTGPPGNPGSDGNPGQDGSPGQDGQNGQDGQDGQDGATGPAGQDGVPGSPGTPGAMGPPGQSGPPGSTGPQGPPGSAGTPGANGAGGFLYIIQNNTSTPVSSTIPTGTYVQGAVAIVQNNNDEQRAFRFSGSAWQSQSLINADVLFANAIGATQLQISADNANTASSIFMDGSSGPSGTGPRILIRDSSAIRVILGRLA